MATPKRTKTGRLYYAQDDPESRRKATLRKRAWRQAKKKLGKAKMKNMDVDHIKPLSQGGGGGAGNVRLRSRHANRSAGGKMRKKR